MSKETSTSEKAPQPNRRGAFFLLFFSLMAIGAGNTMLIAAVIPPLTRTLGLPDWMAGAIFSLSALCWSLSSPFWGKRSNSWGRRRVASAGLAGYAVSMLLLLIAAWAALSEVLVGAFAIFACFALSRTVFGLVGSGSSPAAQAYVADRTDPDERQSEIAFVTSGFSLGTIIGPAFAAVLVANFGLLSPMLITSALAATMSILLWKFLPENREPREDGGKIAPIPGAIGLWRSANVLPFLAYAVSLSLVTGILTQVFVFAVMDKLGIPPDEPARAAQYTGPAFMVGAMAVMTSQLVLIPKLKLRNRTLMIVGCIPLLMGALILIPAQDFATLILAQFFLGIGQGLTRPGFSSGASLAVSPQLQGNVAGLVISANGAGYIVTPLFGLFLYEFVDPSLPFWLCVGLLIAMAGFAYFAIKPGVGEAD
ncbi:MFS transporter [Hyphomonas sp. FCG-A18]|jgi:MFS family permease|uniref:MFS transporter n=1 Tax=Hyphomonas sp. FCG-A18 TaxID=3080019 RepID=UPI002B284E0D|nr:MFS transporter [Hyphomonas sp. FCG-A18]